jgi:hypothetical protein
VRSRVCGRDLQQLRLTFSLPSSDSVLTCTVGQKPSKAEFFLDDYSDVISLLKSLNVVSTKVGIISLFPCMLQS